MFILRESNGALAAYARKAMRDGLRNFYVDYDSKLSNRSKHT